MKKIIIKNIITGIVALFIGISTLIVACLYIFQKLPEGTPQSASAAGVYFFQYYTSDSNILVALLSFVVFAFSIKNVVHNRDEMPLWLIVLYVVATTGTTVTFLTTALYLGPTAAMNDSYYFIMFEGKLFFLHFLTPVLAIATAIFLLDHHPLTWKHAILCISTVVIYSLVYSPLVLSGVWKDFYGFTFGGQLGIAAISLFVMWGFGLGIGFLLVLFHNLYYRKMHK